MNNIAQLLAASKGAPPGLAPMPPGAPPPGITPPPTEPPTVKPGAKLTPLPDDQPGPPDAAGGPVTITVHITATQAEIQGAVMALNKAGMGNIAAMLQKAAQPAAGNEKEVGDLQNEIVAQGNNPHSGMVMP